MTIISILGLVVLMSCGSPQEVPPTPSDQEPGTGESTPGDTTPGDSDMTPGPGESPAAACVRTGCSSTLCVEEGNEVMTTCEYKPEYECYKDAVCERQATGQCGFSNPDELKACVERKRLEKPLK